MNPDDYINKAKNKYLNNDYLNNIYKYTRPKDDPYNNFVFETISKKRAKPKETPEQRKKRLHIEKIKRKLKEF